MVCAVLMVVVAVVVVVVELIQPRQCFLIIEAWVCLAGSLCILVMGLIQTPHLKSEMWRHFRTSHTK